MWDKDNQSGEEYLHSQNQNWGDPERPACEMPGMELAQAFVPFQRFNTIFTPEEGLRKGTAFPELYRPYHSRIRSGGMMQSKGGNYHG